jgi:hypothetical protein
MTPRPGAAAPQGAAASRYNQPVPAKRTFLLAVVVSLCLAALLGIWTFLFGQFGALEERILGTTLSVALFSLTALGAALLLEKNRWRPAMLAALACSGAGLVLCMLVI